jgi:protoporphyrinogen oxidase
MTLAHRLSRKGQVVTLIDGAKDLGGLAGAWRLGDVVWDRHYHVALLSDTYLRALLAELGLEKEMDWVQTRTGFYTDGAFHSMSSSLEFLLFPPLGLISKARLAATIFYASKIKNWERLEKIPVADWLHRWSGKKTLEKIWLPLLRAKLGDSYKKTSATFIWASIARMYAARRTGMKKEMFGYVPGGYARILSAFKDQLVREGVNLMLGTKVTKVGLGTSGTVIVETAGGASVKSDRAVLTVPTPIAAQLCPDLSEDERSRFAQLQYQGIVCASVLLKKPLSGFYVTNITDPSVPFTAVIEMSALVKKEQFGGNTLVYLPKYLESNDPSFSASDEEWKRKLLGGLFRMYPALTPEDVVSFRLSRRRYVYALQTLRYSERVPPRHTSLPGVHSVCSAQILNSFPTVDETIKLAETALPDLLSEVGAPSPDPSTISRASP